MNIVLYSRVSFQGNRQSAQRQMAELERFPSAGDIPLSAALKNTYQERKELRKKGSSELHIFLHRAPGRNVVGNGNLKIRKNYT